MATKINAEDFGFAGVPQQETEQDTRSRYFLFKRYFDLKNVPLEFKAVPTEAPVDFFDSIRVAAGSPNNKLYVWNGTAWQYADLN